MVLQTLISSQWWGQQSGQLSSPSLQHHTTVHSSVSGDSCSEAHTNHDNHDYIIDLISEALSRACVENISERVCDIIDNIISGDESDEVGDINAAQIELGHTRKLMKIDVGC